MPLVITKEK